MGGLCSNYADCCNGSNFEPDENINKTYALTHWYCFPTGIPPWFDNSTQTTNDTIYQQYLRDNNITIFNNSTFNLSDVITNSDINTGVNMTEIENQLTKIRILNAEQTRLFINVPLIVSRISGSMSIGCGLIVVLIFIGILIYQPIM